MRQFVIYSLAGAAIGALLAVSSAPAFAKTVAECNTEYAANKAAIRAAKQTKKDFVAACRAGTETIPATTAAPTAPAGYQQPPAPAPPPFAPSPQVGATGAGQFTTDAQARARCPSDTGATGCCLNAGNRFTKLSKISITLGPSATKLVG
jgi:hypothetical protein